MRADDTIVAVSTPLGQGGLGVVRLSGPDAVRIAGEILHLPGGVDGWTPWTARLGYLLDVRGDTVDQVVATYFAQPRSFTAEDVVEISCHGAPIVLRHCVEQALRAGARHAEPGEFTLRAYVNGRIDLPQAEAIHDLITATTLHQARLAARQMEGALSRALAPLKGQLLELIALLEAGIDFAEDDVSVAPAEELNRRLGLLKASLDSLLRSFAYGRLVHDGVTLALVGRPNVGKSSIFNALLKEERAIVTDIPGTTRDTVSESFVLEGVPVRLVDTAGVRRDGVDLVERLGIERSLQAMADADITLVVIDASSEAMADETELLEKAAEQGTHLVVANKTDLPSMRTIPDGAIQVSARTGEGIEELRSRLSRLIAPDGQASWEGALVMNARHQLLLQESREALDHASLAVEMGLPHELLLLDCYAALRPLDALTGATSADDILNRIFSTFCIGK